MESTFYAVSTARRCIKAKQVVGGVGCAWVGGGKWGLVVGGVGVGGMLWVGGWYVGGWVGGWGAHARGAGRGTRKLQCILLVFFTCVLNNDRLSVPFPQDDVIVFLHDAERPVE